LLSIKYLEFTLSRYSYLHRIIDKQTLIYYNVIINNSIPQ